MATKRKARSYEDDPEPEDVDLEDEQDDEERDGDDVQDDDTDDEENEDDEEEDRSKGKQKAKGKSPEQLDHELKSFKGETNKKLREILTLLQGKGTSQKKGAAVGSDDGEDDDESEELAQTKTQLAQYRQRELVRQQDDAIRDFLESDDNGKYLPYLKSVKYIRAEMQLTEDDLDENGNYSLERLEEEAEQGFRRYAKNAPKPSAVRQGGSAGPGGEPLRGAGGNRKLSEKEREAQLERQFGVSLQG